MGSKDKYSLVTDFSWYITVLLVLAVLPGSSHGEAVAKQLIDVTLRVESVRPFSVDAMLAIHLRKELVLGSARESVAEVCDHKERT